MKLQEWKYLTAGYCNIMKAEENSKTRNSLLFTKSFNMKEQFKELPPDADKQLALLILQDQPICSHDRSEATAPRHAQECSMRRTVSDCSLIHFFLSF